MKRVHARARCFWDFYLTMKAYLKGFMDFRRNESSIVHNCSHELLLSILLLQNDLQTQNINRFIERRLYCKVFLLSNIFPNYIYIFRSWQTRLSLIDHFISIISNFTIVLIHYTKYAATPDIISAPSFPYKKSTS